MIFQILLTFLWVIRYKTFIVNPTMYAPYTFTAGVRYANALL